MRRRRPHNTRAIASNARRVANACTGAVGFSSRQPSQHCGRVSYCQHAASGGFLHAASAVPMNRDQGVRSPPHATWPLTVPIERMNKLWDKRQSSSRVGTRAKSGCRIAAHSTCHRLINDWIGQMARDETGRDGTGHATHNSARGTCAQGTQARRDTRWHARPAMNNRHHAGLMQACCKRGAAMKNVMEGIG